MATYLQDAAQTWFTGLTIRPLPNLIADEAGVPPPLPELPPNEIYQTFESFCERFLQRFRRNEAEQRRMSSELWENKQSVGETTESFVNMMRKKGTIANARPDTVIDATIHGLRSDIKTAISHHENLDLDGIIRWGSVAERLAAETKSGENQKLQTIIDQLAKMQVSPINPANPQEGERSARSPARAVHFEEGATRSPYRATAPYRDSTPEPFHPSYGQGTYSREQSPNPQGYNGYPSNRFDRNAGNWRGRVDRGQGPGGQGGFTGQLRGGYGSYSNQQRGGYGGYGQQRGGYGGRQFSQQKSGDFNPNMSQGSNSQVVRNNFGNLCFRCGKFHPNRICPAINTSCANCGRGGHWRAVCRTPPSGNGPPNFQN